MVQCGVKFSSRVLQTSANGDWIMRTRTRRHKGKMHQSAFDRWRLSVCR